VKPPLLWISPNAISAAAPIAVPPLGRFVLRSQEFRGLAWLARVDPAAGPVCITVA
jgi:hypothetical protein